MAQETKGNEIRDRLVNGEINSYEAFWELKEYVDTLEQLIYSKSNDE